MANFYVNSVAGSNTAPYDTWAKGALLLQTAWAASAAGDTIYVANDHAESQAAAITYANIGTNLNPNRILCVNRAGSVPPVAADLVTVPSAVITTTGASQISTGGFCSIVHGLIFNCSDGATAVNFLCGMWNFNRCSVRLLNTNASSVIRAQAAGLRSIWTDTTMQFSAAAQTLAFVTSGEFVWRGTGGSYSSGILLGTAPNVLISSSSSGTCTLEGVDLTNLGNKTLMNYQNAGKAIVLVKDCKLSSTYTTVSGTPQIGCGELIISSSDSGTNNAVQANYNFFGKQEQELTIIRTGGANDGSQGITWKFTPIAGACRPDNPLISMPMMIWNDAVGTAKTLTVYGITGGTIPTNEEVWIDVVYHGVTTSPIGSIASSGKPTPLDTPTAGVSDSSTWSGSTNKFKMSVTFTPQMKGYITVRVKIGINTATVYYIDPKPVIT